MGRERPLRGLASGAACLIACLAWFAGANPTLDGLLRQADTELAAGLYRDSRNTLDSAEPLLRTDVDRGRAAVLEAKLAVALGQPKQALALARSALDVLPDNAPVRIAALATLGVSHSLLNDPTAAEQSFVSGARLAETSGLRLSAARGYANAARIANAKPRYIEQARAHLAKSPNDVAKANLLITLARNTTSHPVAFDLLTEARDIASELDDQRAASYALGYLAELYETERRFEESLHLLGQARFAAQQSRAREIQYLWEWAAGRIARARGDARGARESLSLAVALLEELRHQLPFAFGERDESFDRTIARAYYDLVDTNLVLARAEPAGQRRVRYLRDAQETMELLKLAELRNYFGDDCVQDAVVETDLADVSDRALVIYPMVFEDRVATLVSRGPALELFEVPASGATVRADIRELRHLVEKRITAEYLAPARRLFDQLVRPWLHLAGNNIDALVFVARGELALIPLGALHDGDQHLAERHPIAMSPGLRLTDPRPLATDDLRLLVAGLSESVAGYPELAHVPAELNGVARLGNHDTLLNDTFSVERMSTKLSAANFNVVHIATHGQFGGTADDSFLLTYDGLLDMNQLEQQVAAFRFRENPLELLTLSACETAMGNDRSALGLSGVAVKAGARSALGTLWRVNDQSAALLISRFYQALADGRSRAEALQTAQQALMDDARYWHPGYWSAFLLISNWL